jgi:phage terminase small subunit
LRELARLGFSNMLDYMRVGDDGDPYLDFSDLTREQAAAIAEVTVEDFKDGRGEDARDVRKIKFKLADKKAPLELLGRHVGLKFASRHEHTGKDGGPIETKEITDLEFARRLAFLLTKGASDETAG